MNLECSKEKLSRAISLAEKAVGKNLALPILSSVLLETKDKELVIRATNLEIGLEIKVPAKITKSGKIVIKASVLNNFLANFRQDGNLKVEQINDNLHFSSTVSSTLIKCYPADDFPILPTIKENGGAFIRSQQLLNGLRSVVYASALSDIKPEIASVYIYQDNQELVFVATDSFRLAEKKIALDRKEDIKIDGVILPFKNVGELIRVLDGLEDEVEVKITKNQASFSAGDVYFTTTVVDGIYPDYRQIMPKNNKTKVTVFKNELIDTLKMSNIFADRFNQINLRVVPKENIFEFNSKNQDVGESTINLKGELTGEELATSFNGRYLLDCLQTILSDQVVFSFTEGNRPLLITGFGDNSFRYLVMPINR